MLTTAMTEQHNRTIPTAPAIIGMRGKIVAGEVDKVGWNEAMGVVATT